MDLARHQMLSGADAMTDLSLTILPETPDDAPRSSG